MEPIHRYEEDIVAVDAAYVRPRLTAIYLVIEKGRVAVVDTGSREGLARTCEALHTLGLTVDSVDYVLLTHVHLDHAGGAGKMMQAFPQARLVVHPRGAPHMIDPSRLLAGVTAVYGAVAVNRLYGEIVPVCAKRIVCASDGLTVDLAGRELLCFETPGHARHHLCFRDGRSGSLFTGDSFGLSYRELDTAGRQFIFPTTTPVQFDPIALRASLDRLLSYQPRSVFLTHYGEVGDVPRQAARLWDLLEAHLCVARREARPGPDRLARIRAGLVEILMEAVRRFDCRLPIEQVLEIFATDLDLNAQGLAVWLDSSSAISSPKG